MFAIDCPYCKFKNTPGARFCAECGAPLHLRPCPKCGKVDDVTAKTCGSCGSVMPPLALAEYGASPAGAEESASVPPPAAVVQPPAADDKQIQIRPLPLILVAIFAGGLPLAWMNRAHLPLPKAWQIGGSNAAGSAVAPPEAPTPPAPAVAVPPPPPPVAAPTVVPEPVVETPAVAPEKKDVVAKSKPAAKPAAEREQRRPPKEAADKAAPAASAAPRPCTEGVAALGLCDPKRDGK
jgi:hypothetical protein